MVTVFHLPNIIYNGTRNDIRQQYYFPITMPISLFRQSTDIPTETVIRNERFVVGTKKYGQKACRPGPLTAFY